MALNKLIRTKLEDTHITKMGPFDIENELNPFIHSLQTLMKEWEFDMYDEGTESKGDKSNDKFDQNKLYMYINLCKYFLAMKEQPKAYAIIENYRDFAITVTQRSQCHHTFKIAAKFFVLQADLFLKMEQVDEAIIYYCEALSSLEMAIKYDCKLQYNNSRHWKGQR